MTRAAINLVTIEMPFKKAPVLEVDGKMLAESHAIARYLARKHGLAGKGDWEQAQADMYVDCMVDIMKGTHFLFYRVASMCISIM